MPSGSHGGGGGSHFGGSSMGGSHFGGSDRGSTISMGPRNVVIFWGGRHYTYSGKSGGILKTFFIFFVLSVVFAIVSGLIWSDASGNKSQIENDYVYYQQMIARAESNSDYKTMAKITDHFFNSGCGKWYYTYVIKTYDGQDLEGYTYSLYTIDEIENYPVDEIIEVAVNTGIITQKTDSVPMDYKGVPIEQDGEYVSATNTIKVSRAATIVFITSSVVFLVLEITFAVKLKKTAEVIEEKPQTTSEPKKSEEKSYWVCAYCGNKNKLEEFNCSHCGAKKE